MRKIFLISFTLILFQMQCIFAQTPRIISYDYWFDDQPGNVTTRTLPPSLAPDVVSTVSVTGLSNGLHRMNVRFRDEAQHCSEVRTSLFYNMNATNLTGYELWFDNSYAGRISVATTSTRLLDLTRTISAAALATGLHVLQFRVKNASGSWSQTTSSLFFKHGGTGNQSKINSYVYWFDNNYASKVTVPVEISGGIEPVTTIATSTLAAGLHSVHIVFNSADYASLVNTTMFYKSGTNSGTQKKITGYRLWFDGDPASLQSYTLAEPATLIELTSTEELPYLPLGRHLVSVDFRDSSGQYSSNVSDSMTVTNCHPYAAKAVTGQAEVCQGASGIVYSIPAVKNATGYEWTLPPGAGIVSGENTNSITVAFSGNAQSGLIAVNATNPCGSGTASFKTVTVTSKPTPTIYGDTAVCASSAGVVYSTESGYSSYSWSVSPGGSIVSGAGTNTVTVSWNSPGGGYQQLTAAYSNSSGCSGINVLRVKMLPLPQANQVISGGSVPSGQTYCGDATSTVSVPTTGNTFNVLNGARTILMAGEKIRMLKGFKVESGGYLHAYITNDCFYCNAVPHTLPQTTVKELTGSGFAATTWTQVNGDLHFRVYPNPATENFTVETDFTDDPGHAATLQLYNAHGEQVMIHELPAGIQKSTYSLGNLPAGIYVIRLTSGKLTGTARFIRIQ